MPILAVMSGLPTLLVLGSVVTILGLKLFDSRDFSSVLSRCFGCIVQGFWFWGDTMSEISSLSSKGGHVRSAPPQLTLPLCGFVIICSFF